MPALLLRSGIAPKGRLDLSTLAGESAMAFGRLLLRRHRSRATILLRMRHKLPHVCLEICLTLVLFHAVFVSADELAVLGAVLFNAPAGLARVVCPSPQSMAACAWSSSYNASSMMFAHTQAACVSWWQTCCPKDCLSPLVVLVMSLAAIFAPAAASPPLSWSARSMLSSLPP